MVKIVLSLTEAPFIPKFIFKIEDHEYLKNLLRPVEFMAPIDSSNALFSISLHKDSKNFCLFDYKGNKYDFNFLSFGLTLIA